MLIIFILILGINQVFSLASDELAMGFSSSLDDASGPDISALSNDEICNPRLDCFSCLRHCYYHKALEIHSEYPSICLPLRDVWRPDYLIYETIVNIEDCVNHEQRKPSSAWINTKNYTRNVTPLPDSDFYFERFNRSAWNSSEHEWMEWIWKTEKGEYPAFITVSIVAGGFSGFLIVVLIVIVHITRRRRGLMNTDQESAPVTDEHVEMTRIVPLESTVV